MGLFSRVLAESFEEVVAVEANAAAVKNLAKLPRKRGAGGCGYRWWSFCARRWCSGRSLGLVVMDPPRAGAGVEVCRLLARMAIPQMVYVSCDPTTLARDLRVMVDSGYNLVELHLVDLFPQTFHLETVAVLQRRMR